MWYDERDRKNKKPRVHHFTIFCKDGVVELPLLKNPPELLHELLMRTHPKSKHFNENIRAYNNMFSFTSMGGKIDHSVNQGRGPYTFRLGGQNAHLIGGLLPNNSEPPKFCQLYIYDTEEVVDPQEECNKISTVYINMGTLALIDDHNPLAQSFRMARNRLTEGVQGHVNMRLISGRQSDGRRYNLPIVSEVAALIVGDIDRTVDSRDIIVEERSGRLQRISELHASYLALQYPLLFARGEDVHRLGIPHNYTMIEAQRLAYLRFNQPKLRSENFKNIVNAAARGQTEPSSTGDRYILSSTFLGCKNYMRETYQDTMTICKWCGYPYLFITFTCNPKWPEISRCVEIKGLKPEDRPDIVTRVFKLKLEELMTDFKELHIFGRTRAGYKRGLPPAHILLFLQRGDKFTDAADVDRIISAEIPDPTENPALYEAVKDLMIHGPCGSDNLRSPCMIDGVCAKNFPKRFNKRTTVDGDGYPLYRRRANEATIEKSGQTIHNGYVYNQARSIKYLFNYINKGYDRVTISATHSRSSVRDPTQIDQIQEYYDCRYISPCEAVWRIFSFDIHYRTPPVLRLDYHFPNDHNVVFPNDDPIDEVVARTNGYRTKFNAWLEYNENFPDGRHLTYSEFPNKYVWKKKQKKWTPRKQGFALGRMYHMSPTGGERYYMRTLLNFFKGPKSYEDIRTVNGVIYPTFKKACYALGLLGDDKEHVDAIIEASFWGTGIYLRNLFLQLSDEQLQNYALSEIEASLQSNGSSLRKFDNMPFPDYDVNDVNVNRLILDELSYDMDTLRKDHNVLTSSMTTEQKSVYRKIMDVVENGRGGLFFVYGYGGMGKTFIWKTLCAAIRCKGEIVLPVASSGIAAILLPRGRTTHSRFGIPINVNEHSTCPGIKPGSDLAGLLLRTKLIIWDEAPMCSIRSSNLWKYFKVLKLSRNMRLQVGSSQSNKEEIRQFSEWILRVGDGLEGQLDRVVVSSVESTSSVESKVARSSYLLSSAPFSFSFVFPSFLSFSSGQNDGVANIELPEDILIHPKSNPIAAIVDSTYPSLKNHLGDPEYFKERAILAPTHDIVELVNEHMLALIPNEERVYLSSDEISNDETNTGVRVLYSTEFLNTIRCPGLPNHILTLKVGAIVMLLRNIDQANGLCNGTRLVVNNLGDRVIGATVISGSNNGVKVYIPRITLTPSDTTKFPVKFQRRQFPLAVCFAMTINKSQGKSLSHVGLYLPRPVFTHVVLYLTLLKFKTDSTILNENYR
ncbi:hypothetical protein RND81_11G093800 [Saponaria officinalis]|uniref:ATP-dependent DNA helicase n=1 Tax=Saponaria officinalis TaxID=3572 RepID=A0AAW1HJX7_SAPOF